MELQAVMEKRRSIRNYNPERKVTKEQLEELIKAASYAPSWKNLQTSRYYCVLSENAVKVNNLDTLEQISELKIK